MQQQEALHLESDIRIDRDPQAVEDAGPRRLEIAVLDHEPVFDDAGSDADPEVNHVRIWQSADHSGTDKFMAGNGFHGCLSDKELLKRNSRRSCY